jgi:hypothetical protein
MRKLFIMLLLAGSAKAQWTPILGFQPDDSLGNFSYYTSDQNAAIEKCKEVLKINDVDLETVDIDKNHDPLINNHLQKPEQPDMVYVVYLAKTESGYVVRLKFIKDEYTEFEEDFMSIVIGEKIEKPSYEEILGNPVRIGDIEVSQFDFADGMNWTDASNECAKLGKGWRLPTYEELILMSRYRSNFDMDNATYWSCDINEIGTEAEVYNFSKTTSFYKSTTATNYVRAVRTYKKNRKE